MEAVFPYLDKVISKIQRLDFIENRVGYKTKKSVKQLLFLEKRYGKNKSVQGLLCHPV